MAATFVHALYPDFCRGCGRRLGLRDCALCDACWLGLSWTHLSKTLGETVRDWGRANGLAYRRCPWEPPVARVRTRAVASMEPVLASAIHDLKYRGRRRVAGRLGRLMARVALSDPGFRSCEGLVPVPLVPQKERERGYNPATLLARSVSESLGIPLLGGVLARTRMTPSQTEIDPSERITNPQGSFRVRDAAAVAGRRLLVVDDVVTSGSTVACSAEVLLGAGAEEVLVLTAARTPASSPAGRDPGV